MMIWSDQEPKEEIKEDVVNKPKHYNQGGIECIDAIHATMSSFAFCEYLRGTVLRYLWRCNYKSDKLKDLRKAQWYLTKLIEEVELMKKENTWDLFDYVEKQ